MTTSSLRKTPVAAVIIMALLFCPVAAHATPWSDPPPVADSKVTTAEQISIIKSDVNMTAYSGIAFSVAGVTEDAIHISEDGTKLTVYDSAGNIAIASENPILNNSSGAIPAKFVADGTSVTITPAISIRSKRAACGSAFWGSAIFNVGMAGVCGALYVGTVVGGIVCQAAVIGANTQINWDSKC